MKKNILIIGATKGIGLETTKQLMLSSNLFTISRNSGFDVELNTQHLHIDAANDDLQVLETFLPNELHGLVYCPGSINLKPFNRFTPADFLADFNQNVMGAIKVIQLCIPRLKAAKSSSVVLFSTVAVHIGMNFHSSVATSKAALEGLSKSLAAEYASANIRSNKYSRKNRSYK
jgi:3-oxoacyl-[acyl-carrier protein] reductase